MSFDGAGEWAECGTCGGSGRGDEWDGSCPMCRRGEVWISFCVGCGQPDCECVGEADDGSFEIEAVAR